MYVCVCVCMYVCMYIYYLGLYTCCISFCSKERRKRKGSRGRDLVVPVPLGTTITTDNGQNIGDLDTVGTRLLVAKGGRGGSPSMADWNGEQGERHMIRLELKLIADVGLIGYDVIYLVIWCDMV